MSRCNASVAVRSALMCVSIALPALGSLPASAAPPEHPRIARDSPTLAEAGRDQPGFPVPNSPGFGAAVAIRNGVAFVGIPAAAPEAHVAVYAQTASGWMRTATLTAPDAASASLFGNAIAFRD